MSENVSTGPTFDQELINETETAAEEGQQKFEDKYNANRYNTFAKLRLNGTRSRLFVARLA